MAIDKTKKKEDNQGQEEATETEGIKRVHYFNGQFLVADDFSVEQTYHIDMLKMHNKDIHGWGVVKGFKVSVKDNKIQVTQGMAIDDQGRQIILKTDSQLDIAPPKSGGIYLCYKETPCDKSDNACNSDDTRILEEPQFSLEKTCDLGNSILLAEINEQGTVNAKVKELCPLRVVEQTVEISKLTVYGDASIKGKITGDTEVTGKLTVDGDTEVKDKLTVDGDTGVTGKLTVDGDTGVTGKLTVDGDTGVTGKLTVDGDASITGQITGDTGVTGKLTVDGNTEVKDKLTVDGDTDVKGKLTVDGGASIKGQITLDGETYKTGQTALDIKGKLRVNNDASLTGQLTADSATINGSLTAASATINGTLTADSATMNGKLTVASDASLKGQLSVAGDTSIQGKITTDKEARITGLLTAGSNANIAGQLRVAGDANIEGKVTVKGEMEGVAQSPDGSFKYKIAAGQSNSWETITINNKEYTGINVDITNAKFTPKETPMYNVTVVCEGEPKEIKNTTVVPDRDYPYKYFKVIYWDTVSDEDKISINWIAIGKPAQ